MTSIIYLLKLVHLNDLLFDEWVSHVVKEVLKASIFVVQKAAAPKKRGNKPKVWSVQLEKTLNFIINFSVPPPQGKRLTIWMEGGEGRNTLAFASLKLYQELI